MEKEGSDLFRTSEGFTRKDILHCTIREIPTLLGKKGERSETLLAYGEERLRGKPTPHTERACQPLEKK